MKKSLLLALLILAGCTSEVPLDDEVGVILRQEYRPGYYDDECGYTEEYDYLNDRYVSVYKCERVWNPEQYHLVVRWEPRRFQDEETGKIRTEPSHIQERRVSEAEYYDCEKDDTWNRTQGTCERKLR